MIVTDNFGLFASVLTDFGASHTVLDSNGEPTQESMVEKMEPQGNDTIVTLIQGATHGLQDGDVIELSEVKGMCSTENGEEQIDTTKGATQSDSVNGTRFKVLKVITTRTFLIDCDMGKYTKFERDGLVRQIKMPVVHEFKPLKTLFEVGEDSTLDWGFFQDFNKMLAFRVTAMFFKLSTKGNLNFVAIADEVASKFEGDEAKEARRIVSIIEETRRFSFAPICAFIGGVVAQEVVKGITQKFTPIKQEFHFDCMELYKKEK